MINKNNYAVSNDGNYLYITILATGRTYYTDYDNRLETLFNSGIIKTAWDNGNKNGNYLKFNLATNNGNITKYFHHIIYCFYYRGLTINNAVEILAEFEKELNGNCIDHLDNDIHNNCKCNLSMMSDTENKNKPNTGKYFKHIFRVDKAYNGTHYIVRFIYICKNELRTVYYACNTPQTLINTLKYIKAYKWQIRANKEGKPLNNDSYYVVGKFPFMEHIATKESDVDIQRTLAERGQGLY